MACRLTNSSTYNMPPSPARAEPPARAESDDSDKDAASAESDDSDEDNVSDDSDEIPFWMNFKPRTTFVFSGLNHNESGIQTTGGPNVGNSLNSWMEKLQIADSSRPQAPPARVHSGYRIFCKGTRANKYYVVTARDGKLFLTLPDKLDAFQFWHKDEYNKSFMIVNDATNKAVKHTIGIGDQLRLENKPTYLDKSLLWTPSKGAFGNGYRFLWTQSRLRGLPVRVMDGTKISLFVQNKKVRPNADYQLWKFVHCCK